jgi:hypothetical protein
MFASNKCRGLVLALGMMLAGCGQGAKKDPNKLYFQQAPEYNNYINIQYEEVNSLWNATLDQMKDSVLVYKQLDSLTRAASTSRQNMQGLGDFKGDTLYKKAAADYFNYVLITSQTSLREAIEIGLKPDISDSLYTRFDEIGTQISTQSQEYIHQLKKAQLDFITFTQK